MSEMFVIGRIRFNTSPTLGKGPFSYIYQGELQMQDDAEKGALKVTIKRIAIEDEPAVRGHRLVDTRADREEKALRELDHPNVRKLLHIEEGGCMRYFALEYCASNLYDYFRTFNDVPMPADQTVILHIVKGLRYVHSMGFAHRNIEPRNILISNTSPVTFKLSDFGLSKSVNSVTGSYSISQDHQVGRGTQLSWMAPESMDKLEDGDIDEGISVKRGSIASDTFSAGCVFFFYLTSGKHPFGNGLLLTQSNIIKGNPVLLKDLPEEKNRFKSMITAMISKKAEDRISLEKVEIDLQKMVGPNYELEPGPNQIPDDDGGGQLEHPSYLN